MQLSRHVYRGAVSAEVARRTIMRRLEARGLRPWSAAEDAALRNAYPDYSKARRALRGRTYYAIRHRAKALGIQTKRHVWTTGDLRHLKLMLSTGLTRRKAAQAMGLRQCQIVGAMRQHRIAAKKRPLVRVRDPLLDSIRQRAAMLNMTLADLNRATKSCAFWKVYNLGRLPPARRRVLGVEPCYRLQLPGLIIGSRLDRS